MHDRSSQPSSARRSPPLGVSGMTLLMLVTLVLTTSPVLARGRDPDTMGPTRLQTASQRALPTQRAEKRLGGQREIPNRQIRTICSGYLLLLAKPVQMPLVAVVAAQTKLAWVPSDRVVLALLNLPPPRR